MSTPGGPFPGVVGIDQAARKSLGPAGVVADLALAPELLIQGDTTGNPNLLADTLFGIPSNTTDSGRTTAPTPDNFPDTSHPGHPVPDYFPPTPTTPSAPTNTDAFWGPPVQAKADPFASVRPPSNTTGATSSDTPGLDGLVKTIATNKAAGGGAAPAGASGPTPYGFAPTPQFTDPNSQAAGRRSTTGKNQVF